MTMHKVILAAEKALRKRAQLINPPISVRELIAYPVNEKTKQLKIVGEYYENVAGNKFNVDQAPPCGEFYPNRITARDQNSIKETLRERLFDYIFQLTKKAEEIHLKENGVVGDAKDIALEKKNNITRLSLPEGALFPAESEGPISLDDFQWLMEQIEKLARDAPENLHLVFSTIPVKTGKNEVKNIAIFVECGPQAALHSFAKAHISTYDNVYPGTTNPNFSSASPSSFFSEQVKKSLEKLSAVLMHNDNAKKLLEINNFEQWCRSYIYLEANAKLLSILNQLKRNTNSPNWLQILLVNLKHEINVLCNTTTKSTPCTTLTTDSVDGMNIHHGANIICKTAAGAQFRFSADICLDNRKSVAVTLAKTNILQQQTIQPKLASYSIFSNILTPELINKKDVLTRHTAFNDAYFSGQKPDDENLYGVLRNDKPMFKGSVASHEVHAKFGSKTNIDIYPRVNLLPHVDEMDQLIDFNNEFIIRRDALIIAKENHSLTQNEIGIYILHPILQIIKKHNIPFVGADKQLESSYVDHLKTLAYVNKLENHFQKNSYNMPKNEWLQLHLSLQVARKLLKNELRALLKVKLKKAIYQLNRAKYSFWQRLFGNHNHERIAITKMLDLLNGDPIVQFTNDQIHGLNNGSLRTVMQDYRRMGLLPEDFTREENRQRLQAFRFMA